MKPMKTWMTNWCVAALLLAGCGGGGSFSLEIVFPDQAARDSTRQIRVVAMSADSGGGCGVLVDGSALPGDSGYPIEAQLTLAWPLDGDPGALLLQSGGSKLFYAEAIDEPGTVRLRGCTPVEADGSSSRLVTIALEWISQACQIDADCPDDDLWCTGLPRCDDGNCVQVAPDCDDQIACTLDGCDEDNDRCTHSPDDSACGDQNICNGLESCDELAGCQPGQELICDDQDVCNGTESCESLTGCQAGTPLDCADGVFCNGDEACDPTLGCQPGLPRECDDGIPCTSDSCSAVDDACEYTPNAGGCPDLHIGPAADSCPHQLPDGSDVNACDFTGLSGVIDAATAAPAEGARFLLYGETDGPAFFGGPVDVPGSSWIGAAPGVDLGDVVIVTARDVDNGVLRLVGDGVHVDGLRLIVVSDNNAAISAWRSEAGPTGATTGHLIERVSAFAVDQEVLGLNSIGPPVSLWNDTTVRNCHFFWVFRVANRGFGQFEPAVRPQHLRLVRVSRRDAGQCNRVDWLRVRQQPGPVAGPGRACGGGRRPGRHRVGGHR